MNGDDENRQVVDVEGIAHVPVVDKDGATEEESHDGSYLYSDDPEDWGWDTDGMEESQTEDTSNHDEVDEEYTDVDDESELPEVDAEHGEGDAKKSGTHDLTIWEFTSLAADDADPGITEEKIEEIRDFLGKSDDWRRLIRSDGQIIWSQEGIRVHDVIKSETGGVSREKSDEDVPVGDFEIREKYLVWLRDPTDAPEGVDVLSASEYDGEPPEGNTHFYEVPFDKTVAHVEVGKVDEALDDVESDPDFPTTDDLLHSRMSHTDRRVAMAVQQEEVEAVTKYVLEQVKSPLTLTWIGKRANEEGWDDLSRSVRTVLEERSVGRVEKVVKSERHA